MNSKISKDDVLRIINKIIENEHLKNNPQEDVDQSNAVYGEYGKNFLNSYSIQRNIINNVFRQTQTPYNFENIVLRLAVIDSFYSTNARYSYFTLEGMAEYILQKLETSAQADKYFDRIAKGGGDTYHLFSRPYGIDKENAKRGHKMISLMSKYAYYCLLQNPSKYPLGFPIYDRLSRRMCNKAIRALGSSPLVTIANDKNIKNHVKMLNQLRRLVFENYRTKASLYKKEFEQFDLLDAYLWRMGKIDEGNISLLLNEEDYTNFIKKNKKKADKNNPYQNPNCYTEISHYFSELVNHWRLIYWKKPKNLKRAGIN
jgi:hypothetical protein